MPIYEYSCQRCGRDFEVLLKTLNEEVSCPFCGGRELKRLMSVCAISTSEGFRSTSSKASCTGCTATSCASCKP